MHRFQALLEATNYKGAYWDIKERLQVQSGDETDRHTSHLADSIGNPSPPGDASPCPGTSTARILIASAVIGRGQ